MMSSFPLLDGTRFDALLQDIGPEMLRALVNDFLAADYETPLRALATQSPKAQQDTLHAIKGVAANMGATALWDLARQLSHHTPITPEHQNHIITVLRETRGVMGGRVING